MVEVASHHEPFTVTHAAQPLPVFIPTAAMIFSSEDFVMPNAPR